MRRRGHMMLEAIIAGAVFITAVSGLAGGLISASRQIAVASFDQQALMIARGEIDALQAQPISSAQWNVGVVGPAPVSGASYFTLTTTITAVTENTGPVTVDYRRARVVVLHRSGRSISLEALRW